MRFIQTLLFVLTLALTPAWSEDRDDWIDPNDMLNFDPSTNTMKKNKVQIPDLKKITTTPPPQHASTEDSEQCQPCESRSPCKDCPLCPECVCNEADRACPEPVICPPCNCDPQKECVCEQAALPLLRQYIKSILTHIGDQHPASGTEEFTFHISLSHDRFTMLHKFVTTGNQKHVHDVHEILSNMIHRVASSRLGRVEKIAQWLEDKIGLKLDRLIQFFMLGALASIVLLIEVKLQIAWRRRVSQLIVLMFVISVPWTWFELYKHAEIKQQSMATRKVPKECEGGERDVWSTMKSYFTLQDDKCHEYYEHLMIDPVIRVPPTKAIAVTFVRFFVAPLKDVGGAMSEFIRALLIDLPVTLYPVAILIVGLFLFMFLFMWFGYSIRLPFFLTIERSPQLSVADSQLHQAIQENTQQTAAQLEKLQARLDSRESDLADKLEQFERKQQLALEYMSSEPPSPATSPSISRSEVRESPSISRSPVKKRSEVKVTSAQNDSKVFSPASCDSIGAKDNEDSFFLDSGAKNRNEDSAKNRNDDSAINRNEGSAMERNVCNNDESSKDIGKLAEKNDSKENNCIKQDIDTLKPDGTRE